MDRLAQLGALKTNEWNYLQEQMSRLVQAWKEGDPGDLEKFLPPPGDVLRAITLQELIMTDLEMRWQKGQSVSLDYYVGKYPELGSLEDLPTKLIFEEYRVRTRYGDAPHLVSYRRRFPRQYSELETLVGQQPPPTPAQQPSSGLLNPFAGTGAMHTPQVVLNSYKLLRRINSGAFADVYEAEALGGVRVALKIIRQPLSNEDAKRELEALEVFKQLSHSCLVQLHAFGVEDDRLCVVMDLGDCTLRDRLQECRKEGIADGGIQGIPPHELLAYFRDAAEALDYLHSEHVLHRDVKPANILLFKAKRRSSKPGVSEGFQARAKLADFGLARLVESARLDASGGGTLAYMAPEACRNRTNPQSDQYSLASSYAELRLGRPLFPYTNMLELTEAHLRETPDLSPLPPGEQKALLRALAKEPEDRFPTCQQFVSALDEVLGPPARPSSRTAVTLAGYRMVRLMGGTARGDSWEAVAPDGMHVGLTVIRNQPWAQAAEECRTFQFLRSLDHPNLARLLNVFLLDSNENPLTPEGPAPAGNAPVTLCLVNELLTESLGQRLDRYEKGMPPRELLTWMWQAADALDTLRGPYPVDSPPPKAVKRPPSKWFFGRGKQVEAAPTPETMTLLHGAISPRSLFVEGTTLKVGDYTLVKLWHSARGLLARDDTLLPGFVAPELYARQAHASSDQYSLAITYVELRTGRSPFQSSAPAVLRSLQQEGKLNLKRLPDPEVDVIRRATALNPTDRYPTCREMVAALEEACFASGLHVATGRPQPPPSQKPAQAPPPVFPAPQTVPPAAPSVEDSGPFHLPPAAAAAVKTLPGTAAKTAGVSETIGHAPPAAGGPEVLQETWEGLPAAGPPTPKKKATDTSKEPPAAALAVPEDEVRPVPAPQRPSTSKQKQKLFATAALGAAVMALVVVGILLFTPPGGPFKEEEVPKPPPVPVVIPEPDKPQPDKPPKPPVVPGPSEEEIRRKANLALEAIRNAKQASEVAEQLENIPKDHPGQAEAQAHLRLLKALEGIRPGAALSDAEVANWLKDGGSPQTQRRLEDILARIASTAEKDTGFAKLAVPALGDRSRFPQDFRGYVAFVQALVDEHAEKPGDAAEKLMDVIAADRPTPRVLTTPERKQRVAKTLTAAAEQSHHRDNLRQPFQGGNAGVEKAHAWLTAANALRNGAADPTALRRAYLLAVASWHHRGRTREESDFVRKTTNELLAKRKELAGELEFGMSFLQAHAESQDDSSSEGAITAVRSYGEIAARYKAQDLTAQTSPEELYKEILDPALRLLDSSVLSQADADARKVMAALGAEYANFLRRYETAEKVHRLTVDRVRREVRDAFRRAVEFHRTPEHALDYVRATLECDRGPVPRDVQDYAEWLTRQPPESATAYRWLARVMQRNAEQEQDAPLKQVRTLRVLRDATRAGLALLGQPGGPQTEDDAQDLKEAQKTLHELVAKAKMKGLELLNRAYWGKTESDRNQAYYEALEWGLAFRGLDLCMASRAAGMASWRTGHLALARARYEEGVKRADFPDRVWETLLRTEHVLVLNELTTTGAAERPTLEEHAVFAKALAEAAETLEDKKQSRKYYGAAHGAAGLAWGMIENQMDKEDLKKRKAAWLKIRTHLEKACEYYPEHYEANAGWRLAYGYNALTLGTKVGDKESAVACSLAVKLLQQAIDSPNYRPYLQRIQDPETKKDAVTQANELIQELGKLLKTLSQ